jgi:hypothetical protein
MALVDGNPEHDGSRAKPHWVGPRLVIAVASMEVGGWIVTVCDSDLSLVRGERRTQEENACDNGWKFFNVNCKYGRG